MPQTAPMTGIPPEMPPPPITFERQKPLPEEEPALPAINWEQFMGVKGLAWAGGFAFFLAIAFLVKYLVDKDLIPPEVRAVFGFVVGFGLVVGGVVLSRKNFPALSQTLCATGVAVLYAATFACRALYHFSFFGPIPTFLFMALVTVAAFLLAVRLNAMVVAILGMLGGFLTPVLLSTGQDNPVGLFGYLGILNAGLILVALNRRWDFLTVLSAAGTIMMQIGWAGKFFESGKYFEGNKIFIALAVLTGFNALYLAANGLARRRAQSNWWLAGANLGLAAVALAFTLFFLSFEPLAQRPILLFSFVFLIDLMVAALGWVDRNASVAQPVAGFGVFGLLGIWTSNYLSPNLLNAGLLFYFVFAVFHSGLPAVEARRRGEKSGVLVSVSHFFPSLALLLVLVPIFRLKELSFLVWPFVLLVDLLAIALAAWTAALLPVLAVLLLTLGATAELIFKIPADLTGLPVSFFLLGLFAVFFVVAGVWLARKITPSVFETGVKSSEDVFSEQSAGVLLSASSAVLPFLLLVMAVLRLPLANPSPVFGLALLLVVLLLGLTRMFKLDWMPVVAMVSLFAVECAWHFNRFSLTATGHIAPAILLLWYLLFMVVLCIYPFLFKSAFLGTTAPWAASALAGPAQFLLIYYLVKAAWPNSVMGLLPAAFSVPPLLSLVAVLKLSPAENQSRMTQLAWFGGVALFFITLIFPVQFDRQWLTIGWALEGAALLWLFHRVPHQGLRLTGLGLLVAAFIRLAFNPAVAEYHPRGATAIFNWYLYSYGLVTAALFAGARLAAPPRDKLSNLNLPATLSGLGTVLSFILLNIEIADFFSAPGSSLTFEFTSNFARDMTYSIAWALFALVLLVYGIVRKTAAARYPAMGLLLITLAKLFLHDLAQLGQLYRIGAFIGVAVVAMLASFAYQKFYSANAKTVAPQDATKS
jgi:uncharacterized membrane protein